MKRTTRIASLVLGSSLVIGAGLLVNAADLVPERQAQTSQSWLSIPQVHDRLLAAGYRNIEKISRDDGLYKVRATTADGKRVKLYLHPVTGEPLDKGQAKGFKHSAKSQTNDPNCSKRRCRDDLPQPSTQGQQQP